MLMTSNRMAMSGFSSTLSLAIGELAGLLGGDLVEDRGDHLARTAPLGPEVDDDRLVAALTISRRRWRGEGDDAIGHGGGPFGRSVDVIATNRVLGMGHSASRTASDGQAVRGVGLEPALGVDRGHAARAGGGDGLAVGVVLDVAAGEHARRRWCAVDPGPVMR